MRLATKEQEMQECTTQIQYLKQLSVAQLRSTMVDSAINLFFLKMKAYHHNASSQCGEHKEIDCIAIHDTRQHVMLL
ncbi:pre-mRNA-splicing regulator WTAP-like protein [Cricetulus griseus]|uniref:Pre-mRNA-splicing regulator WTAP n=1 Tax=Cricetulus griseus TaxID=10029 RepID=A0A061HZ37_CRIGR|nr:pre-mRNA-splicing regulator WTAP-like protein [Cricetulus griseus]